MPHFVVRVNRSRSVEELSTTEIEAANEAEAIEKATAQYDAGDLNDSFIGEDFIEEVTYQVQEFTPAPETAP